MAGGFFFRYGSHGSEIIGVLLKLGSTRGVLVKVECIQGNK